jgi:hypothetical protein
MTNPRLLTPRELELIQRYSYCQFGMTPRQFYSKWAANYEIMASICDRSPGTVQRWFARGRNHRRPTAVDLRHLAIVDFLLEHFEEIPEDLRNLLCPSELEAED